MDNWQSFFWLVVRTSVFQLVAVLGIFFLFGYILSRLQIKTHELYRRVFGWNGILITAWFGTPFHELGHVFFAKLFRHHIESVSLFKPNKETGSLGHVEYSFNPLSLYQRIGNFFIGAAPMIFGVLILTLFVLYLLPNGKSILFPTAQTDMASLPTLLRGLSITLTELWSRNNLMSWSFWLFLYFSFCVVAHMAPSKQDQKNMWSGLVWLLLLLIVGNALLLFIGIDATKTILRINYFLGFLVGLYLYTLVIAILHYLIANIVLLPITLMRKK